MTEHPSQPEIESVNDNGEDKTKTAFLQVPLELKDQIQAYIAELTTSGDIKIGSNDESIDSLPAQGCFLVISLDKIEEIINGLKSCLRMDPGKESRNIKSEIRRVLSLLN